MCQNGGSNELKSAHQKFSAISMAFLALYIFLQCVIPLRHYLYPGDVNWTLEGDRMAWRMKLNAQRKHI